MNPSPSETIFGGLEASRGLPAGILDELWGKESSRGQNMLNPTSGARGHFGIMEDNWRPAGIDPNDLGQSATWTADYAAKALKRFPGMDPRQAILAHHFGGPDTTIWGPKTQEYAGMTDATAPTDLPMTASPTSVMLPPGVLEGLAAYQPQKPSMAQQLSSNPFIQMGLGVLSANQPGSTFGQAVGGGAQAGLMAALRADEFQQSQQMRAAQQALYNRQLQLQHQGLLQEGGLNLWQQSQIENQRAKIEIEQEKLNRTRGGGPVTAELNTAMTLYGDKFPGDPASALKHYRGEMSGASDKRRKGLNDVKAGLAVLDSLEELAFGGEKIDPKTGEKTVYPGAFSGKKSGFWARGMDILSSGAERIGQTDTKMIQYERSLQRNAARLVRAFGDLKISNADIEAKLKGMARGEWIPDSEEVARQVLSDARQELLDARDTFTGEDREGTAGNPLRPDGSEAQRPKAGQYYLSPVDGSLRIAP